MFNKYISIEWYEDIKKRIYKKLNENNYENVVLVGLSMGGAFAIRLSVEINRFNALILLATPRSLKLKNQLLLTVFGYDVLNKIKPVLRKKDSDISKELQRQINRNFDSISIRSVFGLSYFLKENKKFIEQINIPTLLIHSIKDHTIPVKQGKKIYKKIKYKYKKIILLRKSFHILPLDVEKDYVFSVVDEFLKKIIPNK
jgi:carboxylesterase